MATATNILEGVSRLFIGTADTDTLPADTVAFGSSWGGTWRDMGYTTEDGMSFTFSQPTTPVPTAQSRTPPLYLFGNTEDTISATLLEATLLNIKDITGRGTISTLAPSGPTPGYEELLLTPATSISRVAIGFEGVAPPNNKSNPRRVLFARAMATGQATYNQRIGQATGIPCQFSNLDGAPIKIHDVTTT